MIVVQTMDRRYSCQTGYQLRQSRDMDRVCWKQLDRKLNDQE